MSTFISNERILEKLLHSYQQRTGRRPDLPAVYESGKTVFSAGDHPKGVYYLYKGMVKIVGESEKPGAPIIRIAGPDEFIGYVSLIRQNVYASSAVATERSEVLFIPRQIFLKLLQTDIDFANAVVKTLCEHLSAREGKITELMSKDVKQRLAAFLLSLELAYDLDPDTDNSRILLPKKDIAAAVAATPETISRYLAEFKKSGWIKLHSNGIEVIHRNELLQLSKVRD